MILGSVAAIGQKNIKRLLAYSSISHMGTFGWSGNWYGHQDTPQQLFI